MLNEEWKDIHGYDGLYQVSNMGRVRSSDRTVLRRNGVAVRFKGKYLTPHADAAGRYWQVALSKGGTEKTYRVHVLVARAFLPHADGNFVVMHKDEKNLKYDKECNNCANNLKWGTVAENSSSKMSRQRNSAARNVAGKNNPMYGKTHSDETRKKISKKLKGKGGRISRSKKVVCDGVVFDCITDCAYEYGVKACATMSWLRGDRPMREDFADRGLSYV